MVFRFRDIEMTPTIEEIQDCLETKGICHKRKHKPDNNALVPYKPSRKEMLDIPLKDSITDGVSKSVFSNSKKNFIIITLEDT